jgi:hypothetical protein
MTSPTSRKSTTYAPAATAPVVLFAMRRIIADHEIENDPGDDEADGGAADELEMMP